MQFSTVINIFIMKTLLNSNFTNDLKRKKNVPKIFIVTDLVSLMSLWSPKVVRTVNGHPEQDELLIGE